MFKKLDGPTHPSTGRISGPVCSIKEPAVRPVTQWNRTIPRQFKLTPLFCKHGRAPLDLMFWAKAHCWAIFYLWQSPYQPPQFHGLGLEPKWCRCLVRMACFIGILATCFLSENDVGIANILPRGLEPWNSSFIISPQHHSATCTLLFNMRKRNNIH